MSRRNTRTRASTSRKRKASDISISDETNKENQSSYEDEERKRVLKKAKVKALLEDFDNEVDSRVHKMEIESENIAKKLRQSMYVWLLQLPPRVRNLPLSEFVEKYQGDLNKAMRDEQVSMANLLMTPVPDRNELKSSLARATPQQSARLQRYLKQRAARDAEPASTPSVVRPVSHTTAAQSSTVSNSMKENAGNNAVPTAIQSATMNRLMEQSFKAVDKTVVGKSSAAADKVDRDTAEQQILMATRTPTRPKTAPKRPELGLLSSLSDTATSKEDKLSAIRKMKQQMEMLEKMYSQ
jgi:hypothetical protein